MKGKRIVYLALAALLALTAVMAVVHGVTRDKAPEGALLIERAGSRSTVTVDELPLSPVRGTVVNGKGEERTIEADGILLAQALEAAGIVDAASATVTADDEYSAQVTGEELAAPDKVYLIRQEDGGLQLIVFGDSNSKRNVSGVIKISVP